MNLLSSVFSCLAVTSPILARDLLPERWVENVPSTDGAIQQSLVFRTVAGVHYQVETSENLNNWTQEENIYGMGHEFVVPMREFTPPPPLPPGGNPPLPLPPPSAYATLMLRPSSGVEGGTVASWKSLDHGGPMIALLEEELHQNWSQIPLYAGRHGAYYIFIWHTGQPVTPPVDEPLLAERDSELIAQLQASLPEMNLHVAAASALARNAPPPGPPSPGAKKFWRIRADWSVDTDGDESPDWAEFEMAGNSQHPSYSFADAFVADTDGNGNADGNQMDLDEDGTADAKDPAIADDLATQAIAPVPRFALFPVSRPSGSGAVSPPISINDRGTVLWADGCWTNANWHPLTAGTNGLATYTASAQNDLGEIVGLGQWTIPSQPYGLASVIVRWESTTANPAPILLDGVGEDTGKVFHGTSIGDGRKGPLLSNDGRIIARCSYYILNGPAGLIQDEADNGKPSIWTLPGNDRTAGRIMIDKEFAYLIDSNTYWGYNEANQTVLLKAPGNPPAPDRMPRNLVRASSGQLHAFYDIATPLILKDGAWNTSLTMLNGIDMAADTTVIAGKIGSLVAPIRLNGRWQPIAITIPEGGSWTDNTVSLLDTTSGGWILARRGEVESPSYGALLPLRVKGNREVDGVNLQDAVGVDDFSVGSTAPGLAVLDKIWIMAPTHGGETRVKFSAPIHSSCPVKLSGPGLEFNGSDTSVTLTNAETAFTIKATDLTPSGSEIPLVVKLGDGTSVESLSIPIGIKVMKRRTVSVRVWKVKADNGSLPSFNPTEDQLEEYLNEVFESQINAVFDCNIETIGPLNFDTATATAFGAPAAQNSLVGTGNGVLDFTTNFSAEMSTIRTSGYVSTFNINLYIVGGTHFISSHLWDPEKAKLVTLNAKAITNNNPNNIPRECWLSGENSTMPEGLKTAAHEIGHILFGDGHPEYESGPAPLPATPKPPRLMCTNPDLRAIGGANRLTVKGEWDVVVEWFQKEIDAKRMNE